MAGFLDLFIRNCQLVGSPDRTILIADKRSASLASHLKEISCFPLVALVRQIFPVPILGDLSCETKNREVVRCATVLGVSPRSELAARDVRVASLHVGYMDTDMTATINAPKSDPLDIARIAIDGVENDLYEILADDLSHHVREGLARGVAGLYPQLA